MPDTPGGPGTPGAAADGEDEPSPASPVRRAGRWARQRGAAWWTFAGLLVVAGGLYAVRGRNQWFFQDEWVFLALRDGGDIDQLLAPHNREHWSTLPLIAYRILWNVVGLRSYRPYQALSIGLHLVTAVLVRAVMRRGEVGPWPATAGAAMFLLYGAGWENVVWAFQITLVGSIAFGLAHLLLADHPHPSRRRTLGGLLCGLGGLMCSGVGLVMLGTVGLALLLRRGWRAALLNVAPLGVVYGIWRVTYGDDPNPSRPPAGVGQVLDYVGRGVGHALEAVTGQWVLAVLLTGCSLAGLATLAWEHRRSAADLRRTLAVPVALTGGTVAFFLGGAESRVGTFGPEYATRSRFSYVAVALLAPVLVMGIMALGRARRGAAVPLLVLMLVGIPGNVAAIETREASDIPPALVLTVAGSPALASAPADLHPFTPRSGIRLVPADWWRAGARDGRIPPVEHPDPDLEAEAIALAALTASPRPASSAAPRCKELGGPTEVVLEEGEAVAFTGNLTVVVGTPSGGRSRPQRFGAFAAKDLQSRVTPVTLHLTPVPGALPTVLCR